MWASQCHQEKNSESFHSHCQLGFVLAKRCHLEGSYVNMDEDPRRHAALD